jgi:hypothetical protein
MRGVSLFRPNAPDHQPATASAAPPFTAGKLVVGRHVRGHQARIASIRLGPRSASARMSASASSPSVRTLHAGTPKPFASPAQSITGRVRSVSACALGPGSAIPARASSACKMR